MKEYVAEEMLKNGYIKENLLRLEKETLDSLRRKGEPKASDPGSFVGSLF
jgi:hypothetical protein